jgi:hypothetical protein
MSTKFEQLLDYLVNEEMDKANELFHEIVVEKSRDIYENLIAEEADEEMDETREEDEEDESMEESEEELEDSYMMDADDDTDGFDGGEEGDAADKFGSDIGADGDDQEMGAEGDEDQAIFDIKNAIQELEAAFAELEAAQGGEETDMDMDSEDDMDMDSQDDEDETHEMMGHQFEGRRVTREYVEKVGNDWDKNSQKSQGQYAGAGTGEKDCAPTEGRSPISSGSGKPTTGANSGNIAKGGTEGQNNTGTSPNKVNKGITPDSGDKFAKSAGNVPGGKMGVKNLQKVGDAHGLAAASKNNGSEGTAVGAGSGDNSVKGATHTTSPLKSFGK